MQFIHPEYLYGLLAVAIPIIIHLFNFRRFKKVLFTNVAFLQTLKQQTKKQSQLRQLLTLLFRILAVVMLVIAFAQPFFPTDKTFSVNNSNITFIYLDNSFSMEGVAGKTIALQKAKNSVLNIASLLPQNQLYHLISNDFIGGFQLLQKEELITRIANLSLISVQRDFAAIQKRIRKIKERDKLDHVQVYYISDFQRINFMDKISIQDTSLQWNLLPIKIPDRKNFYLDSCWIKSPINQTSTNILLDFSLSNSSREKGSKIPVRLLIDGKEIAVMAVDIEANSQAVFSFNFANAQTGKHEGILEIEDYPISFDNQLYFTFKVEDKVKVLEINEKRKNSYLNALFSKDSLIDFLSVSATRIPYDRLNSFQGVFLNELESFSSGLIGRLKEYVEQGGNLVILPANNRDENVKLTKALRLADYAAIDTSKLNVSFIQLQHKLFANVFEKVPDNPDFPTVFKHYPLIYSSHTEAMSLIDLENGNSLLLTFSIGNGNVFQFASPINDDFTDFQKNAFFVPTFYNMALLSENDAPLYHLIGKESQMFIEGVSLDEREMPHIKSRNNDFEYIPKIQSFEEGVKLFLSNEITKAGIYTVGNKQNIYALLAMNYDRTESELRFMNEEEINTFFEPDRNSNVHLLSTLDNVFIQNLIEERRATDLWFWFVLLSIFFLFVESVILRFV